MKPIKRSVYGFLTIPNKVKGSENEKDGKQAVFLFLQNFL